MKHKYHIVPILVWIGLGLLVMILSYRLGLGGLRNPGPGLMPFLLGFFLCIISFYFLLTFLYRKGEREGPAEAEQGRVYSWRLWLVLASLFAYALLLEPLGFPITTLLILIVLFRSMNNRWASVLLASCVTVLVSYLIFTYLGIRFPKGILKGL
jgi:putative tricarboxylic transport membrane protein